jgi:hypothetical protein
MEIDTCEICKLLLHKIKYKSFPVHDYISKIYGFNGGNKNSFKTLITTKGDYVV